jgi:L-asparaginase
MSIEFAQRMARRVNEVLARPEVSGVVVTHGTDTMEETCYLTDLLLEGDKPVVFTGAQRPHDDPRSDGPRNILSSVRTAAAPAARGLGALLCFNDRIHAARDVTKVHTSALETFQSYEHGALGEIDGEKVVVHRRPALRRTFRIDAVEDRVELIRLSLGFDAAVLSAAAERGAKGLVIEGFGRGNGPAALAAAIRRAVAQGVVVVMTSRCPVGRVEPIYGFGGGGKDLADAGALFAGDLKGPKVRILLMVLLSDPETGDRIGEILGEMAP